MTVLCMLLSVSFGQSSGVVDVHPLPHRTSAPVNSSISIQFDQSVDPITVNDQTISVFGRGSGVANLTFQLAGDNRTVALSTEQPFSAGELVTVSVSHALKSADGRPMRDGGYTYQFWTATAARSQLGFFEIASMTTNTRRSSRPYGGVATDLNNDGWLDVTVVNEDTANLRVFLNQADGTGLLAPIGEATYSVGNRASPSEAHDFDRDGNTDIAVANINDNTVSVLLGNGDGSYAPQQLIRVGTTPRGIAVLDVEGDGDMDIVNTNYDTDNLSLLLNDGTGRFSSPTFFDGGVRGEWSLMAGDMDNDGLSDLVVGGADGQELRVLAGNGDGTFTPGPSQSAGGRTWQIMLGDVNGDGNLDVTTVNGRSDNGAILFGAGNGTLSPPEIYELIAMGPTGGNSWNLATDLGDLDGDGDLDWVTSSFAGGRGNGDWLVLLNDGTGKFDFFQEINSPSAASCALLHDLDNDGDLDLGLIDEVADRLILMRNDGIASLAAGDADQDLDFDQDDLIRVQLAAKYLSGQSATWGEGDWDGAPGGSPGNPPAGNGQFDQFDIIAALHGRTYLTGPYAAVQDGGVKGDEQTSIIYNPSTGEVIIDAPAGIELTAFNISSASGIFTGEPARNLGGSFDNDADENIFKATFGGSFGSITFGNVAQAGLSNEFLLSDLSVVGSVAGGGDLGQVNLVSLPEPSTIGILVIGLMMGFRFFRSTN